jgi:hypothetical protein
MLPVWQAAQVSPIMSGPGRPVPGLAAPVSRANPTGKPSKFSTAVGRKPATDSGAGGASGESR